MGDTRITYEQLFDDLRREKMRDELQPLDPEFYERVHDFLAEKRDTITAESVKGLHSLAVQRATIEYQNTRKLLKELYERRERKIVTLALHRARTQSAVIDTSTLLASELSFFDDLTALLRATRERLAITSDVETPTPPRASAPIEPSNTGGAREPEMEEGDTFSSESEVRVRFLAAVPKFVGKDLKVFGPFGEGDEAELPESVAQILLRKGRAQEVE